MKPDLLTSEPDAAPPAPDQLPANGQAAGLADFKANILLVDDRPDKLLALHAVLSSLDQNIVEARSGKDALRCLLKQEFAVILLDVSMPGMDGFETATLIRQRISSEHTPIIFITSIGNTENQIARGYSLGAVDYMLTPIIPEILRTKVSVFVELHRQTELIKRQSELLHQIETSRHQREVAEFVDRLETETRRNRFFTLALDLLGIAGLDGRLLQVNPAWEKTMGYSETEFKALKPEQIVHPEDMEQFRLGMDALKRGQSIGPFEGRFRHKDGSYRWLGGTAVPFLEEKLIYIFVRDVTHRKQAEDQIRHLNGELEQQVAALTDANRELEAFNYSIAHDLRSPLRSMSGFARALLEDESASMTPLGMEYAKRIARSAKYMDALLLDLLAYSRLARVDMTPVPVPLDDTVREILSVIEKEITDSGARVEVVAPLGFVSAHLPTLKQILSNLISNAIKFAAPDRKPSVRILSAPADGFVRLWVEDNGIGIPAEFHEKIFGLFQRLHDANAYPGTGIGLALVRRGAERMGGHAGVESEPGQGSRFWVDLPTPNQEDHGK